ncbi:hypothetical protein [Mesorhizobium sp.]|uniref:hypothetical protein n=1 Tax=Mesorhizobium sp. TaxID=1871066 RepID=UPI000FE82D90|nr:hypothetical protein [Mesorhizobium sp.]RWB56222.1 MAG: hypothetical protein EOQ47_13850 [Mesorhizobium sp.]
MWEALMMLRLIASVAPGFPVGWHAPPPTRRAAAIKDAIRLSFGRYRLALPPATAEEPLRRTARPLPTTTAATNGRFLR